MWLKVWFIVPPKNIERWFGTIGTILVGIDFSSLFEVAAIGQFCKLYLQWWPFTSYDLINWDYTFYKWDFVSSYNWYFWPSGWWFGSWILWLSIELGMSSSQLKPQKPAITEGFRPADIGCERPRLTRDPSVAADDLTLRESRSARSKEPDDLQLWPLLPVINGEKKRFLWDSGMDYKP